MKQCLEKAWKNQMEIFESVDILNVSIEGTPKDYLKINFEVVYRGIFAILVYKKSWTQALGNSDGCPCELKCQPNI